MRARESLIATVDTMPGRLLACCAAPAVAAPLTVMRWVRQEQLLSQAWAGTLPPRHRAVARRAMSVEAPTPQVLADLDALLISLTASHEARRSRARGTQDSPRPNRWLHGSGEYAGVFAVHPQDQTLLVVAGGGVVAFLPATAPVKPDAVVGWATDRDWAVERFIVAELGADAGEHDVLHAIGACGPSAALWI